MRRLSDPPPLAPAPGLQVVAVSAIEVLANAAIGMVVSWAATFWLLPPLFGISPSAGQSAGITALFFCLSFARAYIIREAFRKWRS